MLSVRRKLIRFSIFFVCVGPSPFSPRHWQSSNKLGFQWLAPAVKQCRNTAMKNKQTHASDEAQCPA
jgi:hypothetical protein